MVCQENVNEYFVVFVTLHNLHLILGYIIIII